MKSSTKLEAHNISHCQRRTKPQPQLTHTQNFAKFSRGFSRHDWTDIHTNMLIAILQTPIREEVMIAIHQQNIFLQEGQHPPTRQRAAYFRLLAEQWAERRPVTQWRHGCRAMRRSVCNAGAYNGGQPLCVQISRERSYLLPIYWYQGQRRILVDGSLESPCTTSYLP